MKNIIQLCLFMVCLLQHYSGSAQGFMADAVNPGRVYREMKPNDVGGSALLFENWTAARVKIINGKLITGLLVNFDVYGNKALYLNRDETFEFGDELEYIETGFDGSSARQLFMSGFISTQLNSKTFVQVLNDGKYRLLKQVRKVLVDNKGGYGSAVENKVLESQSFYFIANNKTATPAKLTRATLEELAGRNWDKISNYIDANNLSIKKEPDFVKALQFLNSL